MHGAGSSDIIERNGSMVATVLAKEDASHTEGQTCQEAIQVHTGRPGAHESSSKPLS